MKYDKTIIIEKLKAKRAELVAKEEARQQAIVTRDKALREWFEANALTFKNVELVVEYGGRVTARFIGSDLSALNPSATHHSFKSSIDQIDRELAWLDLVVEDTVSLTSRKSSVLSILC